MTLLNLTWYNFNPGGGPKRFHHVLEHFVNTALASLIHWQLDPINVKFGSANPGRQGAILERIADNAQFMIFGSRLVGDEDETSPAGTGFLDSMGKWDGGFIGNSSSLILAMNKRFSGLWTSKTSVLGTNGSNAITCLAYQNTGNTGYFRRGEVLQVAGTYQATIREVIPDLGLIFIENWSSGSPTYSQVDSGASLSGLTSGATATVHGTSQANPFCYFSAAPVGTFYLKNVAGAAPNGTVTGGTTGYTGTYSSYVGNEGGKLVVTGLNGRWMLDEVLTWPGGSGEVAFWDWGWDQIANGHLPATSAALRSTDTADWVAADYLVGEDADRLVILFPRGSSATDGYLMILLGKWLESTYGMGEFDVCYCASLFDTGGNVQTLFNADSGSNRGVAITPDGKPWLLGSSAVSASSTNFGYPPRMFLHTSYNIAPTALSLGGDAGGAFLKAPLLSAAGYKALRRIPLFAESNGKDMVTAKALGFFITDDTTPAFRSLLTHPGGDRVGLRINRQGDRPNYIEFTDGSIVP